MDASGAVLAEISDTIGIATNNVAEYTALIKTLAKAKDLGIRQADIKLDSELVVRQVEGKYRTKNSELKKLLYQVRELIASFDNITIKHVPRSENRIADALCNQALDSDKN